MQQANQNKLEIVQLNTISFLEELTDDEAKNVGGGRKHEEKPEIITAPRDRDVSGTMQQAWGINDLGGVKSSAGQI
jgi:hypothetical protein